nr:copia protein [Tanacetum cinerariifolium]
MRALTNHNFCLRIQLLIPKTHGETFSLLIRDCLPLFLMKVWLKPRHYSKGHIGDKDSEGFKPPTDMKPLTTPIADPSRTDAKYQALLLFDDEHMEENKDEIFNVLDEMDEEIEESDSDFSCPDVLKKYDNILPLIERQLVKYLQKISQGLYDRITADYLNKHEEVVASYADLMASIEETFKVDSVLKEDMKKMVESYTTTPDNLSGLTELINNAKLLELRTKLEGFLSTLNTLSTQVEDKPEIRRAEEPEHQHPPTRPIPITTVKPSTRPNLKLEMIRLECNRTLPENVLFVNNMVIEEPKYGMFFIDVFGDQAFQRMNDMHKVDIETLLTYLVMDSNITTPENIRFCLKLRKMIVEHPDQEKLKSKKVKLESVRYKFN